MKVYKVELMVVDFDEIGAEGIRERLRILLTGKMWWSDDHPLKHRDKSDAEYRRLFTPNKQ